MSELLITGGSGFIGSHTCLVLLEAGHRLIVIDNYSNSSPRALERVAELAGVANKECLKIFVGDVRNSEALDLAFRSAEDRIDGVIHFAGLKAAGESFKKPLEYWDVNLGGTRCLLDAMVRHSCRTIVFSSTATLYGHSAQLPITENAEVRPINPYGNSKAAVEMLLADIASHEAGWRIACLRYFNPVGAHSSGEIGEDPKGTPDNLFPFISQVAVGRRDQLSVFGGDWPTPDGSCIRDYIHVMDLAEGHNAALDVLQREKPQLLTLNLGSGVGYSVLEVVREFEKVTGKKIPYIIRARRLGDAPCTVADPTKATKCLGWQTRRSLSDICRDGWSWQKKYPFGYDPPQK